MKPAVLTNSSRLAGSIPAFLVSNSQGQHLHSLLKKLRVDSSRAEVPAVYLAQLSGQHTMLELNMDSCCCPSTVVVESQTHAVEQAKNISRGLSADVGLGAATATVLFNSAHTPNMSPAGVAMLPARRSRVLSSHVHAHTWS